MHFALGGSTVQDLSSRNPRTAVQQPACPRIHPRASTLCERPRWEPTHTLQCNCRCKHVPDSPHAQVLLANQWVCVPAVPMVVLFGRMPMHLQDSEWYTAYTFDVGPGCQLTEAPAAGTSSSHGACGAELRYCMQPVMGGAAPTALDLTVGDTLFKLDADNLLQDALADPLRTARAMQAAYEKYPNAPELQDAFFVAHICHLVEQARVERQVEADEATRWAAEGRGQSHAHTAGLHCMSVELVSLRWAFDCAGLRQLVTSRSHIAADWWFLRV